MTSASVATPDDEQGRHRHRGDARRRPVLRARGRRRPGRSRPTPQWRAPTRHRRAARCRGSCGRPARRRRSATNQATRASPPAARKAGRTNRLDSSDHRSATRCRRHHPAHGGGRGDERLDGTGHDPGRAPPEGVTGHTEGDELDQLRTRRPARPGQPPGCGTSGVHPSAAPVAAARPASTTRPRLWRRAASRPITIAGDQADAQRPPRRGCGEVSPRRTSTPGPSARAEEAPQCRERGQRRRSRPRSWPAGPAAPPRPRPPSATRATGAGSPAVRADAAGQDHRRPRGRPLEHRSIVRCGRATRS